jgi:hypothetical protein
MSEPLSLCGVMLECVAICKIPKLGLLDPKANNQVKALLQAKMKLAIHNKLAVACSQVLLKHLKRIHGDQPFLGSPVNWEHIQAILEKSFNHLMLGKKAKFKRFLTSVSL